MLQAEAKQELIKELEKELACLRDQKSYIIEEFLSLTQEINIKEVLIEELSGNPKTFS